MFVYNKKLQYPVKIDKPNPRLASVIISQYGGPDGELGASLRYLSQRYAMPFDEAKDTAHKTPHEKASFRGELIFINIYLPNCVNYWLHLCGFCILCTNIALKNQSPGKKIPAALRVVSSISMTESIVSKRELNVS